MSTTLKLILTLVAVATLGLSYRDARSENHSRLDRHPLLAESGLSESAPRLTRLLDSDPDAVAADNRLALALIADFLDPGSRHGTSSDEEARSILEAKISRLDCAEELGRQSLAERPNSWRALTAVGASIYLRRSFHRDPKLIRNYRDWEAPLETARALAPHRSEPSRFLAMAYLEIWPMLSAEKQLLTRSMLATGLTDRGAFLSTINPWLQVGGDNLETIDLLPQTAWVFNDLRTRFINRRNLELAGESHRRYRNYVHQEALEGLDKAQRESIRGDFITARKTLIATMGTLPIDRQFEPVFKAVVRALPAGPIAASAQGAIHRWLDYNSQQCLRRHCPLSVDLVERLLPAAGTDLREMRSLLALGNIAAASRKELTLSERCSPSAQDYWLHKSKLQLELSDPSGARQSLLTCANHAGPTTLNALLYDRLFQAVRPGNSATEALAIFASTTKEQIRSPNPHSISPEFSLPAGDYELEFLTASAPGAYSLLEILLDGTLVSSSALGPHPDPQIVSITATGGPQALHLRLVAGTQRSSTIIQARSSRPHTDTSR